MECNKDEATRAKEIAEKKFTAKDLAGAKKFAMKAQNLYPGLEGIPQMLATLDVYISAENKINGEADWYGILGVNPQADDETVRKQYRKLALILHPDKNKSIGAEGAFKSISEAWSLLSDKAKRLAYDHKRSGKVFQKVSTTGGTSATSGTNGLYNFTKPSAKAPKSTPRAGHPSNSASSLKPKHNTFWTVCHRCKMQYEYLRVYLNHNLLCPNCHEPFLAIETAPPSSNNSKSPWNNSQQRQNSNYQEGNKNSVNSARNNATSSNVGAGGFNSTDSYNKYNFQWNPFSKTGGPSSAAQAASVVQQAYEKVKRERGEAQAVTKREEALRRKNNAAKRPSGVSYSSSAKRRKGMEDVGVGNYGSNITNQMGMGNGGASAAKVSGVQGNQTVRVNGITRPNNTKEVSQLDIQTLLLQKAKTDISKKLNEWKSGTAAKFSLKEEGNGTQKATGKGEKPCVNNGTDDQTRFSEIVDEKNGVLGIKSFTGSSRASASAEAVGTLSETLSINVPDPDFHDFDKDRSEKSFGENQVWSAYDGDDGMPRYYALIHSVISLDPFKMRLSWLNTRTNSELGPLNWVASGFSKTCGDFRVGRYELTDSLNSFSHKVRWTKGPRGAIRIFPRKGEVWALYRNWSPDWNELTADEVIHKYDMVEVLDDFDEELGVTVTPLVKVAGFKTVFHQHLDPKEVRSIPREEMFRFSHHVPSYLLTGQEAPNAPKGCRELDPAATPVELLQIITDVKEEVMENEEKVNEVINIEDSAQKSTEEETTEKLEKDREVGTGNSEEVEMVKDSEETDRCRRVENSDEQPVS